MQEQFIGNSKNDVNPMPGTVALPLFYRSRHGLIFNGMKFISCIINMSSTSQSFFVAEEQFRVMADTAAVLIWTADTKGYRTFFNAAWIRFTGRHFNQESGSGWLKGVHPEDREIYTQSYIAAVLAGKDFTITYRLKRHDGEYRQLLDHGAPRYDLDGSFTGYTGYSSDIQGSSDPAPPTHSEIERDRLRRFFMQAPAGICILDGPDLVFELINPPYQELFPKRELLGKPLLEAVPEVRDQPIWQILQGVYTTGKTFEGKELLIPLARTDGGPVLDRYFDFIYQARTDENGKTDGILVFVIEVTDTVLTRRKIEEKEGNLRSMVMNAHYALAILRGPDMRVEVSNSRIDSIWNKSPDETIGMPLLEIFPELEDQSFPALLRQVYDTGTSVFREEEALIINNPSGTVTKMIDFSYDPLLDDKGIVSGIVVSAEDVTGRVKARQALEHSHEEQQALNEELAATNEELASSNEELIATRDHLRHLVDELEKSESRFRSLVQQAPVAIFILRGRQLIIEAVNDVMLKMLGKKADVAGKTFYEALPEFTNQVFFKLLEEVFASGQPYHGNEIKAMIEHDGVLKEGYYTFIYQPIKDESGSTGSIICAAVDVTDSVNARKKVERAEESLQMAIDAAELGSYYINAKDRIFVASPRLKEFFGFGPDEDVPYDAAINQIHPDYRQAAADLVEAAFTSGVRFDMEYPVIGYHDGRIRWVRGIGTVLHDSSDNSYFTGVLHEITERKQDEIRKNDFIGMVSHELKTPLTSLTAAIQLLQRQLADSEDPLAPVALTIANTQVKKMNKMINSFLNVSRLESGKINITVQDFNLVELIREVISEIAFTVTSHQISFSCQGPIFVGADRDKIGAVVNNFLTNAIKYSPDNETIEVGCVVQGDEVTVEIKDKGLGIPATDTEKIFDRYHRVETHTTRNISGFGIGLYLSAEIIRRHKGNIGVISEKGQGSTFYFTLPRYPR
jgi:two-component system sensor histidine kinase VicK